MVALNWYMVMMPGAIINMWCSSTNEGDDLYLIPHLTFSYTTLSPNYTQKELQNLEEAGDELMLADDDEPAVYPSVLYKIREVNRMRMTLYKLFNYCQLHGTLCMSFDYNLCMRKLENLTLKLVILY